MKTLVIAVGRLKADFAQTATRFFLERLQRYAPVEVVETKDVSRRGKGTIDRCRAEEAVAIRALIPRGSFLVALDERGAQWTSRELAGWMEKRRDTGVSCMAFIVGGPDGLAAELRKDADRIWSLSALTFSHELARVLLTEQLYRAATIMAGHPYHRD